MTHTEAAAKRLKQTLDESALKRLRDAFVDGVSRQDLMKRFNIHDAELQAAVQGVERGQS